MGAIVEFEKKGTWLGSWPQNAESADASPAADSRQDVQAEGDRFRANTRRLLTEQIPGCLSRANSNSHKNWVSAECYTRLIAVTSWTRNK